MSELRKIHLLSCSLILDSVKFQYEWAGDQKIWSGITPGVRTHSRVLLEDNRRNISWKLERNVEWIDLLLPYSLCGLSIHKE